MFLLLYSIVNDQDIHDLSYKGQLSKTIFLAIFLTFEWKSTQLRVTFFSKYLFKKIINQLTQLYSHWPSPTQILMEAASQDIEPKIKIF
jgi:hypothetical protein